MSGILKYAVVGAFVGVMSLTVLAVTQQENEAAEVSEPQRLPVVAEQAQRRAVTPETAWYDAPLQVDGLLLGEIHALDPDTGAVIRLADMRVTFVQDGYIVANARTDVVGRFQAAGLEPGVYSVIVTGSSDNPDAPDANLRGLATFGVKVTPNQAVAQLEESPLKLAAMQQGPLAFLAAVIPRSDFPLLLQLAGEAGLTPVAAPAGLPGAGVGGLGAGAGAAAAGGALPLGGFAPPGGGGTAGAAGAIAPSIASPDQE